MGLFSTAAPDILNNLNRAEKWLMEQFEPAPTFETTAVTAGDPNGGAQGTGNPGGPAADALPAADRYSTDDAQPKPEAMTSAVAPRLFSDSSAMMSTTSTPTEVPGNMPTEVPGNGGGTPTEAFGNARGIPTEATGPRTEPMEPPVEGAGGAGSSATPQNVTRPDCPQPNTGPKHDTIPDAPPQGPGLRTAWDGMKTPEAEEYGNRTRGIGSPPVPTGLDGYLRGVGIFTAGAMTAAGVYGMKALSGAAAVGRGALGLANALGSVIVVDMNVIRNPGGVPDEA